MSVTRRIWKASGRIVQPLAKWYFSKPRPWRYNDLKVIVDPGVFHPQLTVSTRLLLDHLSTRNLEGQTVLELGSGSGVISVYCAQKGAVVTAVDIADSALRNTEANARRNEVTVTTIKSDLMLQVPDTAYDLVVINPPYYPKDPESEAQMAWFCGASHEYFHSLFAQVAERVGHLREVVMILSVDCDLDQINEKAQENNVVLQETERYSSKTDVHILYRVISDSRK